KPICQINTRLKAIADADLDFVTKGDLIGVFRIGCARPRNPVLELEAAGCRGGRFINEAEVPRAAERQPWQNRGYEKAGTQRSFHLTLEAIRSVSRTAAGQLLFFSVCLRLSGPPMQFQLLFTLMLY